MKLSPALLLAVSLAPFAHAADKPLAERITPLAAAHKGKVAVAVKHLGTGETFTLKADEPMPTASLIKFAVLVETYWQAHEGKVKLDTTLTLTDEDKVPGAGVLRYHFSAGATFPLKDAVRLMVVYSDNTATNMVLDKVGIAAVNDRMAKLGLPNTKLNAKVFKGSTTSVDPARTKQFGLGSTTANETLKLLELLHTNKLSSADDCKAMLGHLRANDDKEMMVRRLPPGTAVAHKTGAVSNARTDAGIIFIPDPADAKAAKQPVALCVLTTENEDKRWVIDNAGQVLIADIAREVYDYFAAKK